MKKLIRGVLGWLASVAVVFNRMFNKGDAAANPAGKGTGNEARPRRRLVDGVDADRFTRLCVVLAIGFVSLLGAVLIAVSLHSGGRRIPLAEEDAGSAAPSGRLTISFGGNIMPSQDMVDAAITDSGYQFHNALSELSEVMAADITVAGLCGQVDAYGKEKNAGGFDRNKNYPDALASAVSELGVQHIFGANQHAFANGYDAMCATVTNLHMHSMSMIGLTTTDPQKINARVVRVNGVSVGLAGYNCADSKDYDALTDEQKTYIAQTLPNADEIAERAAGDIARLKSSGAEFIVVCITWGGRGTVAKSELMKQTAPKLAQAGADVIVGYGPCVTLDAEILTREENGVSKECYVFYSLGCLFGDNTYSGSQKSSDTQKNISEEEKKKISKINAAMHCSMTVTLSVARGKNGTVSVESAGYSPIYIIRNAGQGEENAHLKYMAVPAAKYVSAEERPAIFADDAQWKGCKEAFTAICAIADKTDGRLVLRQYDQGEETVSDPADGKI